MWLGSEGDWRNVITSCCLCPGKNTKKSAFSLLATYTGNSLQQLRDVSHRCEHTHTHTHPTLHHHWAPTPATSGLRTPRQLKFPREKELKAMQVTASTVSALTFNRKQKWTSLSVSRYPEISVSLKWIGSSTVWHMRGIKADLGQNLKKNVMHKIFIFYPAFKAEP